MTTRKVKRILVPTDFSETAGHALRYASDLARNLDASLTVLYADLFTPPIDYTATVGGWDEGTFELLKGRAEEQLQRDAGTNVDAPVPYDTVVRVAPPVDGILAQADESGADLIVMGTHGRTGFRRLVLGSVTEAVMRRSEVPVIAVPPHGLSMPLFKTIVCPVIYNAQCLDALTFAAQLAPPDARFIVMRAKVAGDPIQSADDLAELRAWVPETIATRCELKILDDEHVARQIEGLAAAAHADLIVAADPGDCSFPDALHGTFAARLAQHSECPVLTVNASTSHAGSRVAEQERKTDVVCANQ